MLRKVIKSQVFKRLLLSLLSAILLILSFPRFNIEIFAWFGFLPLFFALRNKSKLQAFILAYITGVIFWFGIIYWLIHVTLPGTVLLVLYLALYFAFFGLIVSRRSVLCTWYSVLFIPSLWVVLEYLRSHLLTGFPWALLGYSQYLNLPAIQIADITGAWGVSFLVMMANVAIREIICYRPQATGHRQKIKKILFLVCGLWFVACGYGFFRLNQNIEGNKIKISVIQGNIPQELKWQAESEDFIIKKYMTITAEALKENPDLIVWPEASVPVILGDDRFLYQNIKGFIKSASLPMLLGAVTKEDEQFYNNALLISREGELLAKYSKLHLVPFGEYIPFKKTFSFLETVVPIGDFTAGKEYTVFKLQAPSSKLQANFSVLICFEDLFPELSREFVKRGADFLINITNDAWFKRTSSPYQHLQASVFRAVENRLPLLRSANTGISGFIAPNGKILSLVQDKTGRNIFIGGFATEEIAIAKGNLTFYTRYGDIFVILCFLVIFGGIFIYAKHYSSGNN